MPKSKRLKRELEQSRTLVKNEDVDLTPLVDCVFMLLIFFMVTTVFITSKGLNVDMPKDSTAESKPGKDINLIIEEDGVMELNGEAVSIDDLPVELKRLKEQLETENMILQAHPTTIHNTVAAVVDIARAQGLEGVAFAREQ
ncbi:MAG: biopolymer transporter ExbD [Chloroflexi bacterium]|nr:biopolymer transporter ExbD [Chloroflexota bacterium]